MNMADLFLSDLQSLKQSFSSPEIDPNLDFVSHFAGINPCFHEAAALNFNSFITYSNDHLITKSEDFPGLFIHDASCVVVPPVTNHRISNENDHKDKKRKAAVERLTSVSSSPRVKMVKSSPRRGKKEKNEEQETEKFREVVHIRAKRGQATDSHSLAERVRRGKINERLRCLKDIVPGCYKTMGMAVMLDEIINYVQSLQNQIEFLSTKLTAASTSYDFNSETDITEAVQGLPLHILQKVKAAAAYAQFAPSDLNFEFYPQFLYKNE